MHLGDVAERKARNGESRSVMFVLSVGGRLSVQWSSPWSSSGQRHAATWANVLKRRPAPGQADGSQKGRKAKTK